MPSRCRNRPCATIILALETAAAHGVIGVGRCPARTNEQGSADVAHGGALVGVATHAAQGEGGERLVGALAQAHDVAQREVNGHDDEVGDVARAERARELGCRRRERHLHCEARRHERFQAETDRRRVLPEQCSGQGDEEREQRCGTCDGGDACEGVARQERGAHQHEGEQHERHHDVARERVQDDRPQGERELDGSARRDGRGAPVIQAELAQHRRDREHAFRRERAAVAERLVGLRSREPIGYLA